jgi:hypothetical protein
MLGRNEPNQTGGDGLRGTVKMGKACESEAASPLTCSALCRKELRMKLLLLALVVGMITACAAPAPYEQKIEGVLLKGGAPAAGIKVRFLSEYPEGTCEAPGLLEAKTDPSGKFSFTQPYTPSKNEKYAVLIHPYRLCISTAGQWRTVWKLTTGPAPTNIVFRCELDDKGDAVCKVAWNGQGFR